MAFDGSLVFDTQIDTGSTRRELAELQQEFSETTSAIKSQIHTIKDLEEHYAAFEEESKKATDPHLIELYNNHLKKTDVALKQAKERLIELRMQSNEMKETLKDFAAETRNVGTSLNSLGKRIIGLARRVFLFSVIARSFNNLRVLIVDSIPGITDLQLSFNELKIAIVRAAAPLMSILVPALKAVIQYIVEFVNSIRVAITALMQLFGVDVADDAEVTNKAMASLAGTVGKVGKAGKKAGKDLANFDEIMKIGAETSSSEGSAAGIADTAKAAQEAIPPLSKFQEFIKAITPYLIGGVLGGTKGLGVAGIIDGIRDAVVAYNNQAKDGIDWSNLSKNALSSFKIIAGAALAGGPKGAGIAGIIKGIADAVVAYNDVAANGINWANLTQNAASSFEIIGGAALVGGKKGAGVAAIIKGIADAISSYKDIFEQGLNWQNLIQNAASTIEIIGGAYLIKGAKGAGVAMIITGIANAVVATRDILEKGINWQNLTMFLPNAIIALTKIRELLGAKGIVKGATSGAAGVAVAGAASVGILAMLYNLKQILDDFKKGQAGWVTALNALALALTAVGTAMVFINASNPLGWIMLAIGVLATLAAAIIRKWDKVKEYWGKFVEWLKKFWQGVKDWFKGLWDGIVNTFKSAWNGVKNWFEELWNSIANWFESWWDNSFIGKMFNKVSSWFGGGSKKSMRVSNVNTTQLTNLPGTLRVPALARGAVIPPNNSYLAVVGDQRNGTNIETPLQTMVDAFKQALAESGIGSLQAVMQLDGVTFGKLVYQYNNSETARVGLNLITRE